MPKWKIEQLNEYFITDQLFMLRKVVEIRQRMYKILIATEPKPTIGSRGT